MDGEQVTAAETICALSSGAGKAGIAVIRISGPRASTVLGKLCGKVPPPRHAGLREMRHPQTGELLDRGLALWLPAPKSFTGEDMAELHGHGGRAVLSRVLDAVLAVGGVRLAEAGEFARRAFENGKLDLTEVEGLADLIDAETEAQARQALAQSEGGARALYEGWRDALVKAQALTEATLDFADEADVAADAAIEADCIAADLCKSIAAHLADRRGERLRDGFRVVIAGPPNVGKSSLLNALARRDVAIVSEEAGTTRDVIEVHLDLGGLPVIVTDTAGLREAGGTVEAEGIKRALARVEAADLVLWLIDATDPSFDLPAPLRERALLPVLNKVDAATARSSLETIQNMVKTALSRLPTAAKGGQYHGVIAVSARTGEGLPELIEHLSRQADKALSGAGEPSIVTRARHRAELESAAAALQRYRCERGGPELKAEELRLAAQHLGRLTGRIHVEEVLGAIFGQFCIGK